MTKHLDPARDDAGSGCATARLRRSMTQTILADLACISPAFVSMVETGQRELTRASDDLALADILHISAPYLADGREDILQRDSGPPGQRRSQPAPPPPRSPATSDSPAGSASLPAGTAARPGTGCAAWPATPA